MSFGHVYSQALRSSPPRSGRCSGRYFTNLDGPVFALVNLPEVVKGALFARYSRSSKSLRRLFLDEFFDELDVAGDTSLDASVGLRRAEELYARVFSEYGDDSVAQLGGVHLACEQSSNVLTKILERGRLMSYLEQSTRYIPYDSRLPSGHYRYHRDQAVLESPLGARYVGEMDRMFDTYGELLPALQAFVLRENPRHGGVSELAHRHAVRARCLDALRGLLPGRLALQCRDLRLRPELRAAVVAHEGAPSARGAPLRGDDPHRAAQGDPFVSRQGRPARAGRGLGRVPAGPPRGHGGCRARAVAGGGPRAGTSVTLTDFDPAGEDKVLVAMCYPHLNVPEDEVARRVAALGPEARRRIVQAYVGERSNRRHRPGRALEATSYRFDIVADYGAFRDLQRHRMLTVEWQPLGTDLGFEVPTLVEAAGLSGPVPRVAGAFQEPARRPRPLLSRAERLRGGAGFQHPLRAAAERPRGDARPRTALRAAGTSRLSQDRPRDAPPHSRAGRSPRNR